MKLNKVCDIRDWDNEDWLRYQLALGIEDGKEKRDRKHWEWTQGIYGLDKLGCLTSRAVALGVGCGHEPVIYYLANRIKRIYATDLYKRPRGWRKTVGDMLQHPEKYAPFPYRKENLIVEHMEGCNLLYPDNYFDIVFSFSTIEQVGGQKYSAIAIKEMARVLKPKGVACITTEYVIKNKKEPDYFTKDELYDRLIHPSGLKFIGNDIDFYIPPRLIEKPFLFKNPLVPESEYPKIWPKIVFDVKGMLFTSVCFFLRK